jgi:uncharacterized DUF497 family protein
VRRYDWDPPEEAENRRKHGVGFDEAESVLAGRLSVVAFDDTHSFAEPRFVTVGWSSRGRLLMVVTCEGETRPRIMSARRATKRERDALTRRSRHP